MANLNSTDSELKEAWRALCQRWEEAKAGWNDPVRQAFEKDYWTPLEKQVPATQREMQRLAELVAKVRKSVK